MQTRTIIDDWQLPNVATHSWVVLQRQHNCKCQSLGSHKVPCQELTCQ